MQEALRRWHQSEAAVQIASEIMARIGISLMRDIEAAGTGRGDRRGVAPAGRGLEPGKPERALQESWHG
jgi:hypothetical protein